ncbi:aldose 1-epimerase family protein [Flavobacterium sp. AS60]|uniref:aldose 1-epimerase family protein n=1 Tax=Flavobacterium anseongense TaxID=2910677 RepID=UPI001F1913BD|nr:aldose 1-epimerase family protein [Flavobacterium sp. AS60]MCF6128683.1 aldose 1-epimerase family protein [Flavobacterium sp. AS60]
MTTTISNSALSVTINHKGAELISIKNTDSNREYIWEGNPDFWGKHSPILFPIVGTLKNNSYTYKNNTYELSRHGFARDMDFNLISHNENEAVFSLLSNELTKEKYPFEFELRLIYTLINSELKISYQVINIGSDILPFSIGGHPAFALHKKFEDYSLQFETEENLISYELDNDLLSEKTKQIDLLKNNLPLTYSIFENDALIFKKLKSKQIQILESNIPILNFKFNDFPHFGIWTKVNAPFICLEPWVGYSDILNTTGNILEKEAIQILESNSSKEYSFSIEIL